MFLPYRTLATSSEKSLSALWGVLASEILMERWDVATEDLMKLKEIIDSNTFAPILEQLQQRCWLMHWSLYIFFNHDNGRNQIIDLFFQDRYSDCLRCRPAPEVLSFLSARSRQGMKCCGGKVMCVFGAAVQRSEAYWMREAQLTDCSIAMLGSVLCTDRLHHKYQQVA